MKIKLCFVGSLPPVPPAYSGVADYNYSILTEFSKHLDVTCLVDRDYVDLPKNINAYNINNLTQEIPKDFDIIHFQFNNNHFITSIIKSFEKLMTYEIPKVSTFHDLRFISSPTVFFILKDIKNLSVIPSILKGNLLKTIIENSNKVVIHSNYAKNVFTKNCGNYEEKFMTILHGIPMNNSEGLTPPSKYRRKLFLTEEDFIISTFGYIAPRKGYEEVFRALKLLKSQGVRFKYLGVGDSFRPYEFYLRFLAEKYGITKNVKFVGFIPKKEMHVYFGASDVIIQPRKYALEGVSGALLYALSSGTPVITSNVGYVSEYVIDRKTGLLTDHNPEEIYNRIMELYSDSDLRRKIGENAYTWCRENISWEVIVKKYIELYQAVILEKAKG